jgi:hypothetical protein
MAVKSPKDAVATLQPENQTTPAPLFTNVDIEDAIADELLNDIDWQKVRAALLRKAPAKLFAWLTSGSDRPVNISAFPELAALPSSEDQAA